jgi:hypothetical protein
VIAKWADHLEWESPEAMAECLAEAAGFVAARALSTKQAEAIAKLAETAARVRGWPRPAKRGSRSVVVEVAKFTGTEGRRD